MPEKPRFHAFIDESLATKGSGGRRDFYILAVAYVPVGSFRDVREALLHASSSDFMHATELLRSNVGRREVIRLCQAAGPSVKFKIFFKEPLLSGDRDGEATRIALFKAFLADADAEPELQIEEATYEVRRDGYMRQADNRTIRHLAMQHPKVKLRPQSPSTEKLLWLADLAAAAFRQSVLRGESAYMDSFLNAPEVILA